MVERKLPSPQGLTLNGFTGEGYRYDENTGIFVEDGCGKLNKIELDAHCVINFS